MKTIRASYWSFMLEIISLIMVNCFAVFLVKGNFTTKGLHLESIQEVDATFDWRFISDFIVDVVIIMDAALLLYYLYVVASKMYAHFKTSFLN